MANPMNLFRRYQKIMLAVLGILCMGIFVVAEPLMQLGRSAKVDDPVVVRTNFGELKQSDLQQRINARERLNQFIVRAISGAAEMATRQQGADPQRAGMLAQTMLSQLARRNFVGEHLATESAVVRAMLLEHNAKALGMTLSDREVFDLLRQITFEQLSVEQLAGLARGVGFSEQELLNELRGNQLANQFYAMMLGLDEFTGVSPEQRWEYFQRLNRAVSIEALPLKVADFVGQVSTPDENQLQTLYEQHKHDVALRESPTPGFHEPAQGKFQYFKAAYEPYLDEIEVPPAEVYAAYENERESTHRLSTPAALSGPAPDSFPSNPAADQPAPEGAAATPEAAPATREGAPEGASEPKPDAQGATEPGAPATGPAAPSAEPATPAAEPGPAVSDPAAPAPPANKPGDGSGGDDGAATVTAQPVEGSKAPEAGAPAAAAEAAGSADASTTAEPAAAPEASDNPSGEAAAPPAEGAAAPAEPAAPPAPAPEDELTFESWEDFVLPQSVEAPRYRPLLAVYDSIRRRLAARRVGAKIDEVLDPLRDIIEDYAHDLEDYNAEKEKNKDLKPPAPLDLAALAKEHGLTAHSTEFISRYDAAATTDLGKSFIDSGQGQTPFVSAAFSDAPLYSTQRSVDNEGNRYLFWKTEQTKEQTPSFEESRPKVLAAWKLIEARKLALKKAESLAAEARTAGKSLKEVFAAQAAEVVEVANFTWLTEGDVLAQQFERAPPKISELPGIDAPGDRFMAAVYALVPGEVAATINAPESTAYVVRMTGQQYSDDLLRTRFLAATYETYFEAGSSDERAFVEQWDKSLETAAGLTWVRPADQRIRRSGRGGI